MFCSSQEQPIIQHTCVKPSHPEQIHRQMCRIGLERTFAERGSPLTPALRRKLCPGSALLATADAPALDLTATPPATPATPPAAVSEARSRCMEQRNPVPCGCVCPAPSCERIHPHLGPRGTCPQLDCLCGFGKSPVLSPPSPSSALVRTWPKPSHVLS